MSEYIPPQEPVESTDEKLQELRLRSARRIGRMEGREQLKQEQLRKLALCGVAAALVSGAIFAGPVASRLLDKTYGPKEAERAAKEAGYNSPKHLITEYPKATGWPLKPCGSTR